MTLQEQVQKLQEQYENLRQELDALKKKMSESSDKKKDFGPPSIMKNLKEKLDLEKEVDAGVVFGSIFKSKHEVVSSLSTNTGLERWLKVPESYVSKIVQPFTNPSSIRLLKTFLDEADSEKTREELKTAGEVSDEKLDELLKELTLLNYVEWNKRQEVKADEVESIDLVSLTQRGRTLFLNLLCLAERQRRKYEVEET